MISVRPETPADRAAIRAINEAAFEQPDEADLVDRLRENGDVVASLIAEEEEEAIGHILFSRLTMSGSGETPSLAALAPMAVVPDWQGKKAGTLLAAAGLGECRARGVEAVIVLGHADYYPRFGFSASLAASLDAPFSGESFMALELEPGALARAQGKLIYPAAFGV